jgi:hypothetical protein
VTGFVNEQLPYFSTESIRNALKYLPEGTRRKFLMDLKAAQRPQAAAPDKPRRCASRRR